MQCLWLTLADPDPATNGQLIYSKGLIEAARDAGAMLRVIGLARRESTRSVCKLLGIDWRLAEEQVQLPWRRLLLPMPVVAQRGNAPNMKRLLDEALAERPWDAIVFDSICSGWALAAVARHRRQSLRPPHVVYLAHNHEVTVGRRIAKTARGLRRVSKAVDYLKVRRLERRLVAAADLVTSNTPDDCRRFAAGAKGRSIVFLPPGYAGARLKSRTIDDDVPRRAILVSSLDWPPKRAEVEAFLSDATAMLAREGIGLQVVGEAEPAYLETLRRRFPSVDFVGRVDDVRPYMRQARLALVPDLLGGFKLKGLDYVFNRLPILAMRTALPGMPLEDAKNIGLFDSHAALADGVVELIDDFPRLNAWQVAAYDACADRFDWRRIGHHLVQHLAKAERLSPTARRDASTSAAASRSAHLAAGR
jgi:glycosyltransferase involved in cell wall biosynthesis